MVSSDVRPGEDRRRIQTAVLGSADSQQPLVLPAEAIELQAFRHRYEHQTFWCGTWLAGCGRQLTTKLYVDRVCHFAHHPDTDTSRAPCARRARDETSADHLYVRAAAAELLHTQAVPGDVVCSPPGATPAASVVRIRLGDGTAVTVHMSGETVPDWDGPNAAGRTVVEDGVRVDRQVLELLPYVHRIRCERDGTSRRVHIGTQTAGGTQWFRPDECSLGPAGLVTPALKKLPDRPVLRPRSRRMVQEPQPPPRVPQEVKSLLLRLATARRGRDIAAMRALVKECDAALTRRNPSPVLRQARDAAQEWLRERSNEVITQGRRGKIVLAGKAAEQDKRRRKERSERAVAKAAAKRQAVMKELGLALEQERFGDVRALLRDIQSLGGEAALTPAEQELKRRARERVRGEKSGLLQEQVARRRWIPLRCPRCRAAPGQDCFDARPGQEPLRRPGGHDERLAPIAQARAAKNQRRTTGGGVTTQMLVEKAQQVPCPVCRAPVGEPCNVPRGHSVRWEVLQLRGLV